MTAIRAGFLGYGLDRPISGIGRYAVEIGRALAAGHADDIHITLLKPFTGREAGLDDRLPSSRMWGRLLPAYMALAPFQIPILARRLDLDLVHDPFGVSPFLMPRRISPVGRITTIHDAIPFLFPESQPRLTNLLFRRYIPRTARFVDRVVTVSESSRRDIARHIFPDADRISVIRCGVSPTFSPASPDSISEARERYRLPERYILTVGALQPRKNLETLFEAYYTLRRDGATHRLVVAGDPAWKTVGVFRRLRQLGLESEVTFTGYVADEDLPAIYSGADAFVFPSLYEGFGLPPLEAMACGVPVIASNAASLPEVIGDAGLLVAPRDVGGFVAAIRHILGDYARAEELRRRGIERAKLFTWERSARAHVDLYREVAAVVRDRQPSR